MKKKIILVGHSDDGWGATLKGHEGVSGSGKTKEAALGDLVAQNLDRFPPIEVDNTDDCWQATLVQYPGASVTERTREAAIGCLLATYPEYVGFKVVEETLATV